MEAEKATDMPRSGWASPVLSWLKSWLMSPEPTDISAITSATEPMVWISPQKVPSRPRKISSPVMYRAISRPSSRREAMPSSTLRMAGAERESRSLRRCASMLAMGPSRRGVGRAGAPMRGLRKFSSHSTSGRSSSTCRSVQAMPTSSTPRIRPLSTRFVETASASCGASRAATTTTAARKPSMRQR